MDRAQTRDYDPASLRPCRVNIHGHALELRCALPGMRQVVNDLFAGLLVSNFPEGFQAIEGSLEPYDVDAVSRSITSRADRVNTLGEGAELWRDGERLWMVDDSFGVCEVNLIKRSFRSWLLPACDIDPIRALDPAIFWPLSQLLMPRGLAMVPGASIVHNRRGVLLICPFNLEPELSMALFAGHGLIAQRWTAVREDDGRPVLLQVPGFAERVPVPQLRARMLASKQPLEQPQWVDLSQSSENLCHYAWCDAVLLVEPGRRAAPHCRQLMGASAIAAVKHAWPVPDIAPGHRQTQLLTRLAQTASIFQVELARDARALLTILDQLPLEVRSSRSITRVSASTHVAPKRTRPAVA